MYRWVMGAVVGVWAGAIADCSAADRYIGAVDGFSGAARIAFVVEGDRWLAYACGDSDQINESISRWWKGTYSDRSFRAEVEGSTLTAKTDGGKVVGAVKTTEGQVHAFAAKKVAPGARAGAYRATATGKSGEHMLSWIVDADGVVVGCNKGAGKRRALKPAKLAPPLPKPVARRKPKPADDEEASEAPPAKSKVKGTEDVDEEDAEVKASADDDDDGEKFVGKKVVSASKPSKAVAEAKKNPADSEVDEEKDDDDKPVKKPAKSKPVKGEDDD